MPEADERAGTRGPLRRLLARALPGWAKPRLGEARAQYRPRPLKIPARYQRMRIPDPAPSISIVTPSLNQGSYIHQAIESVLGQDYPALEYTVMDGGSQDGTPEVLDRYRERFHHVETRPDQGPADAINRGFERSSGEIMGWLNADDLLLPGSLAYIGAYFAGHPEVDVVYGHRILLDERGRDVGIWVTPRHSEDSLRWFDFVPQEASFWRRGVWARVGGVDESFEIAFDWDLFLRLEAAGARITRVPRFLGGFRLHPGQKSAVKRERALIELDSLREHRNQRPVGLDEAQARVDRLRARSILDYVWHRAARRVEARLPVPAP